MLTRILYIIFILVLVRFIVRLVRELVRPDGRRARPTGAEEDPKRGHRVIDVEYTEEKPSEPRNKETR